MRGLAYTLKTLPTPANALGAQKYLREAVRLDPKFALSWALLSYVDSRGYLTESLQPTVALREEARQAAETALTLQPNLGEAVLAKGAYHYFCLKDYDTGDNCGERKQRCRRRRPAHSRAVFLQGLEFFWQLPIPNLIRVKVHNGDPHPMLHLAGAKVVQERSPMFVLFEIFGDVF